MSAENTRDFYRNQGAEAERERIIKLLNEAKTYQQLELVIDRIKGETE